MLFFVLGQQEAAGADRRAEHGRDRPSTSSRDGIIMQTIGEKGLKFTPFLLSLFFFIFFCNIFEIIPFIQMPANARIALPLFLALIVWVIYNVVGLQEAGLRRLLQARRCSRPACPAPCYILVTPDRVRLDVHRAALLALPSGSSPTCWPATSSWSPSRCSARRPVRRQARYAIVLPLPLFAMLVLTGFELLVAFLQAFIFTILTAVYIGGAMHPEH